MNNKQAEANPTCQNNTYSGMHRGSDNFCKNCQSGTNRKSHIYTVLDHYNVCFTLNWEN